MITMWVVQASVDYIIYMVAMHYCFMTAARAMYVLTTGVNRITAVRLRVTHFNDVIVAVVTVRVM